MGGEFYHGMTYAGHPAACAVALEEHRDHRERRSWSSGRAELGPYFAKALASLDDHPIVGETRSVGLIGAIEIASDKKTRERFKEPGRVGTICRDHCFNERPDHAGLLGYHGVWRRPWSSPRRRSTRW